MTGDQINDLKLDCSKMAQKHYKIW